MSKRDKSIQSVVSGLAEHLSNITAKSDEVMRVTMLQMMSEQAQAQQSAPGASALERAIAKVEGLPFLTGEQRAILIGIFCENESKARSILAITDEETLARFIERLLNNQ